ncbi:haloalkane dehalogenase [Marinobacter salicampi]|uniref:haloalkane dehalogenase n=1 Tax=Marinobacter salicampi TaxID=435907 RepID=UPI001407FC18|nr:haloalkane dehalogenase [Marinobacter salicampi]
MKTLRTPESRFKRLLDYPFEPHYLEVDGMRMHYVDEGPSNARPVLMLHGEPSWSYLYRHMIPICAAAGHRVIAPDLIGFGKSDKPVKVDDYSYQSHLDWLLSLLDQLALTDITLVCQDWGSLLGLRLAAEHPDRFRAIVVGNGMLPTGDQAVPKAFQLWRGFAMYSPWFPISRIVNAGSFRTLGPEERRAYDAPFPSSKYKAGTRAFPKLVPVTPDNPASEPNRKAWKVLENWQKPFLTTFSNGDPIMRGGDKYMQERIPGAKGQPHVTLTGGHFLQEDSPVQFARTVNDLLERIESDNSQTDKSGQ